MSGDYGSDRAFFIFTFLCFHVSKTYHPIIVFGGMKTGFVGSPGGLGWKKKRPKRRRHCVTYAFNNLRCSVCCFPSSNPPTYRVRRVQKKKTNLLRRYSLVPYNDKKVSAAENRRARARAGNNSNNKVLLRNRNDECGISLYKSCNILLSYVSSWTQGRRRSRDDTHTHTRPSDMKYRI